MQFSFTDCELLLLFVFFMVHWNRTVSAPYCSIVFSCIGQHMSLLILIGCLFQEEITDKKMHLDSVNRARAELESAKLRLENQLTTNLHKKRENLQSVRLPLGQSTFWKFLAAVWVLLSTWTLSLYANRFETTLSNWSALFVHSIVRNLSSRYFLASSLILLASFLYWVMLSLPLGNDHIT